MRRKDATRCKFIQKTEAKTQHFILLEYDKREYTNDANDSEFVFALRFRWLFETRRRKTTIKQNAKRKTIVLCVSYRCQFINGMTKSRFVDNGQATKPHEHNLWQNNQEIVN